MRPSRFLWKAAILCPPCLYLSLVFGQTKPASPQALVVSRTQPFSLTVTPGQFARLLEVPSRDHSAAADADLGEVHRAEQTRSTAQVKAAQFDDTHEDIFLYSDILGPNFTPDRLPLTADLSGRIRKTAGSIDNPLKAEFRRLRPYNFDSTLHPVCETNKEFSYPSGHAVNGYLFAFLLAEMLPEKRNALLERANRYAHNRVVCGVHYPSDVEASRRVALVAFGALLVNPEFVEAFRRAEQETRAVLIRGEIRDTPLNP